VSEGAPPVEMRALSKRYGERLAVGAVDLTVQAGDVYGYLGPNGRPAGLGAAVAGAGGGQLPRLPGADPGHRLLWPLLSALTRNSAAAVMGTLMFALLMQLIGILPGLSGTQPYLLSTQLSAWQGFFRVPTDWLPIVRGL
jgi:hypothetical protein